MNQKIELAISAKDSTECDGGKADRIPGNIHSHETYDLIKQVIYVRWTCLYWEKRTNTRTVFNVMITQNASYLPDIGTRSLTVSAFRMRWMANATTCWHQKMSWVSQVQVTAVILQRSNEIEMRNRRSTPAPTSKPPTPPAPTWTGVFGATTPDRWKPEIKKQTTLNICGMEQFIV